MTMRHKLWPITGVTNLSPDETVDKTNKRIGRFTSVAGATSILVLGVFDSRPSLADFFVVRPNVPSLIDCSRTDQAAQLHVGMLVFLAN